MKKRTGVKIAAISLAAAAVVPIAAGCGAGGGGGDTLDVTKLDPTAVMQEVQTNMSNVTAMDLTMGIDMSITSPLLGDEPMAIDMEMDMLYKQSPLQMMMEMDAAMYGQQMYVGMYLVPDGDGYTAYLGEQESMDGGVTWQKTSVTGEDAAELESQINASMGEAGLQQTQQINDMLQGAMSLQITGLDQVNGEAAIVMSGQMNMEDAMGAMNAAGGEDLMGDMAGMEAMFNDVTVPVTYYIDADEKTLLKCDMDMKEMLNQVLGQAMNMAGSMEGMEGMENMDLSQLIQINTAAVSMQIDAVNEEVADIVVPGDVLAQAVELNETITAEDLPMLNGTMMGI